MLIYLFTHTRISINQGSRCEGSAAGQVGEEAVQRSNINRVLAAMFRTCPW